MATALFAELANRLKPDGIDIDTWVFKFYSRVTVGLFLVAAGIHQIISFTENELVCKGTEADSYDVSYCWLHGFQHLPINAISRDINGGEECFSPENVGKGKISNYHIWISLVLFLCGAAFAIPNEIWKHFEGGMMKQYAGLKTRNLEEKERKEIAEQFKNLTYNFTNRYFFAYVFFEAAYFTLGVALFYAIDAFLDGKFMTYGSDTFAYLRGDTKDIEVVNSDLRRAFTVNPINPMCNVFPTVVACNVSSGSVVKNLSDIKNILCTVERNIMNQKIFLILWVWFMILFSATLCQIVYRIITIVLPSAQEWTIKYHLKSKDNEAIRKLKLGFCDVGNWFLLTQIGSNSDPYVFRKFLEDVADFKRSDADQKKKDDKQRKKKEKIKPIKQKEEDLNERYADAFRRDEDQKIKDEKEKKWGIAKGPNVATNGIALANGENGGPDRVEEIGENVPMITIHKS